jgi:hypothetical protein
MYREMSRRRPRAFRWLSLGMSIVGMAMSASGVIVLVRGDGTRPRGAAGAASTTPTVRATTSPVGTPAATAEPMLTAPTAASALPPGWRSCVNSAGHFTLGYPPPWTAEECHLFRVLDSGDAGVGFIEAGRVSGMTFDEFVSSLDQAHGEASAFTHTTITSRGRTMVRARGTLQNNGDTMRALFFIVDDASGPILVRRVTSYVLSAADEDEIAAMAASVAPA